MKVKDDTGETVALRVGNITKIEGHWFRVHKTTPKDITFRRLNAKQSWQMSAAAADQREAADRRGLWSKIRGLFR